MFLLSVFSEMLRPAVADPIKYIVSALVVFMVLFQT